MGLPLELERVVRNLSAANPDLSADLASGAGR